MHRVGHLARAASLLVLFTLLLSACGGTSNPPTTTGGGTPSTKPVKSVALVTDVGGLNDNGFNQLAFQGYDKAQKQYGFKSQVIQTQNQNDYVNNLTLAAKAADMVIAVGFLMQAPLDEVAKKFPDKKFAMIDGCAQPSNAQACDPLANVAPLFFKEQEAGCLVGAMAAQMEMDGKAKASKLLGKKTISAVGGISIPPVNRYIAGYKFCAKKVDPSVNVVVNYSQDFVKTAVCKDVALSQIAQHQADIIFQVAGNCGVGALDAANEKGVYGIGVDADQGAPQNRNWVITSALKRVNVAVYDTINTFEDGKFTNSPPKFDLAHDGVGFATPSSDVPDDAKAKAEDFAGQIKSGTLTPPEDIPAD